MGIHFPTKKKEKKKEEKLELLKSIQGDVN